MLSVNRCDYYYYYYSCRCCRLFLLTPFFFKYLAIGFFIVALFAIADDSDLLHILSSSMVYYLIHPETSNPATTHAYTAWRLLKENESARHWDHFSPNIILIGQGLQKI